MYGEFNWWHPFDESTFRIAARSLVENGRTADGMAGFKILVEVYPESWRAWRDFGKAYLKTEQRAAAMECLLHAHAIHPGDTEVNELIESL